MNRTAQMALLTSASLLAAPAALAQSVTTVDDVVVTASTRAQKIEQAPATITLITAEQLESRAYADLFDAVRDVEGVSVSGGSNFQDIFIRGLPGAYTLTLVDGRGSRRGTPASTATAAWNRASPRPSRPLSGSRWCAGRCRPSMGLMRSAAS